MKECFWVAEIYHSATGDIIWNSLPMKGRANIWGGEIYLTIPVEIPAGDNAKEIVEPGELGYWPTGNAFCIFFGPTPVSSGPEPRAYSPVNVFGRITGELEDLKKVIQGDTVSIEKAQ